MHSIHWCIAPFSHKNQKLYARKRRKKTPRSCFSFHNWALKQTPLRLNLLLRCCICVWIDSLYRHSQHQQTDVSNRESIYTSIRSTFLLLLLLFVTRLSFWMCSKFIGGFYFWTLDSDATIRTFVVFISISILFSIWSNVPSFFVWFACDISGSLVYNLTLFATVCVCVFIPNGSQFNVKLLWSIWITFILFFSLSHSLAH